MGWIEPDWEALAVSRPYSYRSPPVSFVFALGISCSNGKSFTDHHVLVWSWIGCAIIKASTATDTAFGSVLSLARPSPGTHHCVFLQCPVIARPFGVVDRVGCCREALLVGAEGRGWSCWLEGAGK